MRVVREETGMDKTLEKNGTFPLTHGIFVALVRRTCVDTHIYPARPAALLRA